jgi:hypothetical protein
MDDSEDMSLSFIAAMSSSLCRRIPLSLLSSAKYCFPWFPISVSRATISSRREGMMTVASSRALD